MKRIATLFNLLGLVTAISANNISISNLSLTGKNTGNHYTMVQFDISWENSWRTSTNESNWDAAWVFVKYRISGGAWQHAWLNEDGHTAPAGSVITPGFLNPDIAFNATTNPGIGAFIYRDANGTGPFSKTGVQLRWNYGANGVADGDVVEIKVLAIEMVYVPQGSFYAGDGTTSYVEGQFTAGNTTGNFQITGETVPATLGGTTGGNLGNNNASGMTIADDFNNSITQTLPAAFPKGYNAFYCMKYEISQQGYVDFLNTLTQTQATARKYDKPVSNNRYEITGSTVGSYATANPYVACNFLSWADVAAWLDWSGLRPMTELEYEKACRGSAAAVANEYAWGTSTMNVNTGITNAGAINETSTNSGNCTNGDQDYVKGPMRVGALATASSARTDAGSSYYGIMEMSGNLWERPVTLGNSTGRGFTGKHGDGLLNSSGLANTATWPDGTGEGTGYKGSSWYNDWPVMRVSDRNFANLYAGVRANDLGGRGVRTQLPFTCGVSTFTINHLASAGAAPVDKTVTYGTVSTSLFGGTKCAITRNLGASQQATAATDATEASAGWYWQFNRKQGYKHDGTTRTPNTTWINFISESSDWTAANDPCTLELGTGWRIPTYVEWSSADGSWGNYNNTYSSDLKIHAAGYLYYSDGSLYNRGTNGDYWSSTQEAAGNAYRLVVMSGSLSLNLSAKAYGFSVRCLKDLLPTLTTTTVSSITQNTASSGGNITDQGGSPIIARGVCWSTTTGPSTALTTKTSDGSGTGTYTSAITGLVPGTLYYVRAYATNSIGTSYGNEVTFSATCFIAGTKITMADGSLKNIEEIKVGEKVKSVKTETMEVVNETVEKTYANPPSADLTKITFSNGETNTNTKTHPYWVVGKGWCSADQVSSKDDKGNTNGPLSVGNQCLIVENGKLVQVTITRIDDQPKLSLATYNFSVSHTNCYFANGILVHNLY